MDIENKNFNIYIQIFLARSYLIGSSVKYFQTYKYFILE